MSYSKIRSWVENNFLILVIISSLCAVFIPGMDLLPKDIVPYLLATIVMFSCALVRKREIKNINPLDMFVFYILRFIVLPALCYLMFSFLYPDLKEAVLLLLLMPAGTMVPAIAAMMKGNVSLGISGVILSSFLVPVVIPAVFSIVGYSGVEIDVLNLFISLCIMIVLPVIIYFVVFSWYRPAKKIMSQNARAYSIVMICIISSSVIAGQRESLFNDPMHLIVGVLVTSLLYFIMYGFGFLYGRKKPIEERIGYAVLSGTNNIALALALAVVFFPPEVGNFILTGVIIWIGALPIFNRVLLRYRD